LNDRKSIQNNSIEKIRGVAARGEEVEAALKSLKKNKSPGFEDIPIDFSKPQVKQALNLLPNCAKKIWNKKTWPNDWKRSVYIPISNKRKQEKLPKLSYHRFDIACK